MKLSLQVNVDGFNFKGGACVDIPEVFVESFSAINENSDPILNPLKQGVSFDSHEMKRVVKLREDASEFLSEHLARLIIKVMKENDTYNGYKR